MGGIYVEILVRAPMEALWDHTQTPALHERWDLCILARIPSAAHCLRRAPSEDE